MMKTSSFDAIGPALLVDRELLGELALPIEDDPNPAIDAAAANGACAWIRCEGTRDFEGTVEVWFDEPPPDTAREVLASRERLLLRAPSGRVMLAPVSELPLDADDEADLELELPPGTYEVDIVAFESAEMWLGRQGLSRSSEQSFASLAFTAVGGLLALVSLLLGMSTVGILFSSEPSAAAWPALLLATMWGAYALVYSVSGQRARSGRERQAGAAAVAMAPPAPDFRVLVRRADPVAPAARGGGLLAA